MKYVSVLFDMLLLFLIIAGILWMGFVLYKWLFKSARFGRFVEPPKSESQVQSEEQSEQEKGSHG